ncbi:MAG: HesA/MoeB/ThiF family protein [Clostridiales bacterium]|nr:HesA/MoeB/ThiF family protein [Clostridiales bacterium]
MMRYSKNEKMLTPEENKSLKNFRVAVIGCGGLGGYCIEMLARLGIGSIVCVDGDVFDESNLNRQLLSEEALIGHSKAGTAKKHVAKINSKVQVMAFDEMLTEKNYQRIIERCDVLVDAVDSIDTKLFLQNICEKLNLPLVHGAIGGWYGQVSTVLPGDRTLDLVYKNKKSIEKELGNPSFTPGTIASIQVAEVLKVLLNKGDILTKKLLFIDLLNHDYEVLEF